MLTLLALACTGSTDLDSAAVPSEDTDVQDSGDTDTQDSSDTDTHDSGDTAGEGPGAVEITDVSSTLSSEVAAVITVTWQSNRSDDGAVQFGVGEETIGQATAVLSDGVWKAVLVGIPADSTGWFSIGHGERWSDPESITTGTTSVLPAPVEVSGDLAGFTLTTFMAPGSGRLNPVILNGQGEPVWWHTYDGDREGFSSRTVLAPDGQSIYYNIFHITLGEPRNFAGIVKASLDGETVEVMELPENHHDFLIHDDGTIATLMFDRREVDGQNVAGDAIVEVAPDGTQTEIWNAWDHLTWDNTGTVTGSGSFWTLANSLEYDADRDQYLMSARDRNSIIAVDRSTGAVEWILGGVDGTLSLTDSFVGQHGFARDGDDLLVFDNRGAGQVSRVIRYTIDADAGTATTDWIHNNEPSLFTEFFGDVVPQPDGSLLLAWGMAGRLSVLDSDRNTTSVRAWTNGSEFGFATQEDTIVE
jgi:hypothetical protein